MTLKSVAQTLGNVVKTGIFAGSLASPVIGAIVGGAAGGVIGAAVGLFAGPVVVVGALMTIYGVNKLVRFTRLPEAERKAALDNFDARQTALDTVNGFARGLAWAVNLSTFVGTLGRSGTSFDWGQPSYDDMATTAETPPTTDAPGAQTPASGLPVKPLTEPFAGALDKQQKPAANVAAPDAGKKANIPDAHKPAR